MTHEQIQRIREQVAYAASNDDHGDKGDPSAWAWASDYAETVGPLLDALEAAQKDADRYRIEADCGLRDYDDLELRFGQAHDALTEIAEGRRNKVFDPWARNLAKATLTEVDRADESHVLNAKDRLRARVRQLEGEKAALLDLLDKQMNRLDAVIQSAREVLAAKENTTP